jgi:hypothetical protein
VADLLATPLTTTWPHDNLARLLLVETFDAPASSFYSHLGGAGSMLLLLGSGLEPYELAIPRRTRSRRG